MHPLLLLPLLESLNKSPAIETYKNFPDVIKAGKQQFDKEEIVYLLGEGLISETSHDSFGAYLNLTEKAKNILNHRD